MCLKRDTAPAVIGRRYRGPCFACLPWVRRVLVMYKIYICEFTNLLARMSRNDRHKV